MYSYHKREISSSVIVCDPDITEKSSYEPYIMLKLNRQANFGCLKSTVLFLNNFIFTLEVQKQFHFFFSSLYEKETVIRRSEEKERERDEEFRHRNSLQCLLLYKILGRKPLR